jgi:hypothetical protein
MSETVKLPIRYGAVPRNSGEPSTNERRALWIETGVLLPDSGDTQCNSQEARPAVQPWIDIDTFRRLASQGR